MTIKKILIKEEKKECAALKSIYEQKKRELGLNHDGVAEEFDLEIYQGGVSHYLNDYNSLNLRAAINFSRILKIGIADFSERLAKQASTNKGDPNIIAKLTQIAERLDSNDLDELIAIAEVKARRCPPQ